jgi:hypothetical protein
MATYSQEAKRLVLVSNAYIKATTDIATGQVGLINANGADITPDIQNVDPTPEAIKLMLKTDLAQFGFVNPLNLLSETITKDMIMSLSTKSFAQPKRMTHTLVLDTNRTYQQGEEVVLSAEFDSYGSVSNKNIYSRYGAYWVPVNGTTAATVAAALVTNFNKNVARDMTPRVKGYVGAAGFLAAVGDEALTATNGSNVVVSSADATGDFAGIAIVSGSPYFVTVTTDSTDIVLDRPFEGTSFATQDVATVAANSVANGIYLIAEQQVKIDFHNMFIPITFKTTLTVDGEAAPLTSHTITAADKGNGYGPEVVLIEEFANNSTTRQQYIEVRKQYDARLQAIASKNYDVVNIKLGTTKVGSGSNVTSIREIQVFVDIDTEEASAAELHADLLAWKNS